METLTASELVSLISSVGFPIVACIGLYALYEKTLKELQKTIAEINTTLNIFMEYIAKEIQL